MQRVGRVDVPDVGAAYEQIGRQSRARIERLVPADWSWEGKRVLDFGCGAGRTLRQFFAEAERAEFCGCDIDGASIAWLEAHLSPPFRVFQNRATPPLPESSGSFDLIYALSVFTHLAESSPAWLLELHRLLKPEGLLIATFLNEGLWAEYGVGEWDEDRIGMNVIMRWNPWDTGGPVVFHSEWWIREHWGRAFDVRFLERYDPHEGNSKRPRGQGAAVLRPLADPPDAEQLMRPADDAREAAALQQNVEQLQREAAELFAEVSWRRGIDEAHAEERDRLTREVEGLRSDLAAARAELETANETLARIARSHSWRLTAPLRAGAALISRRDQH